MIQIVVGSPSDNPAMQGCKEVLDELNIPYFYNVASAHRTPEKVLSIIKEAEKKEIKVFIAAAGGAAHLAGFIAAHTILPVIGVPIETSLAGGLDSLLSTVQMPSGIPVATVAVGKSGPKNAALLAASILAVNNTELTEKLKLWREKNKERKINSSST
ncbi:MAG: 5-(carboxyamino)imidazole ribonucleotide mutase [Candidatus Dadabacteria bacterium]|nr:MAG: 5-(carboxyamino)imidazole ribonucleotide mutase [Candidatus Dadabacteria bacterium]